MALKPAFGTKIILNSSKLRKLASTAVQQYRLSDRAGMRVFAESQPMEPMLVHMSDQARPYYLVPFRSRTGGVQAAMILNAYTGLYEQSIVLSKDCFFKFLTRKVATKLTADKFRVPLKQLSTAKLLYTPSVETPNRFFPVWRIRDVKQKRDLYVTPRGEALNKLANTEEELWKKIERR